MQDRRELAGAEWALSDLATEAGDRVQLGLRPPAVRVQDADRKPESLLHHLDRQHEI